MKLLNVYKEQNYTQTLRFPKMKKAHLNAFQQACISDAHPCFVEQLHPHVP
jgi:hypothetical protein